MTNQTFQHIPYARPLAFQQKRRSIILGAGFMWPLLISAGAQAQVLGDSVPVPFKLSKDTPELSQQLQQKYETAFHQYEDATRKLAKNNGDMNALKSAQGSCGSFLDIYLETKRGGLLYLLGECDEINNKTASAFDKYQMYAKWYDDSLPEMSDDQKNGHKNNHESARKKIEALEPLIPTLLIRTSDSCTRENSQIQIDKLDIPKDRFNEKIYLDPGSYRVILKCKQLKIREEDIVFNPGDHENILMIQSSPQEKPANPMRIASYVTGGVGLAGLGVALTTFIISKDHIDSVEQKCGTKNPCDQETQTILSSGQTLARVATGTVIGGSVASAAGLVLFLLSRSQAPKAAGIPVRLAFAVPTQGGGFVGVSGEW